MKLIPAIFRIYFIAAFITCKRVRRRFMENTYFIVMKTMNAIRNIVFVKTNKVMFIYSHFSGFFIKISILLFFLFYSSFSLPAFEHIGKSPDVFNATGKKKAGNKTNEKTDNRGSDIRRKEITDINHLRGLQSFLLFTGFVIGSIVAVNIVEKEELSTSKQKKLKKGINK